MLWCYYSWTMLSCCGVIIHGRCYHVTELLSWAMLSCCIKQNSNMPWLHTYQFRPCQVYSGSGIISVTSVLVYFHFYLLFFNLWIPTNLYVLYRQNRSEKHHSYVNLHLLQFKSTFTLFRLPAYLAPSRVWSTKRQVGILCTRSVSAGQSYVAD